MLVTGAAFFEYVLAVHIVAVLIAFGATFAFPLLEMAASRRDPRAMPFVHRLQVELGRKLINPGLLLLVIAGIYLASDLHLWKHFFVGWGLAVAIVLGGLEGAFMIPREKRLAELAERDVAAGVAVGGGAGAGAGDGPVEWSEGYLALSRLHMRVGAAMSLLVVLTVFIMTVGANG